MHPGGGIGFWLLAHLDSCTITILTEVPMLLILSMIGRKTGYTVIPRLTSDPANEFFGQRRFFRCFLDSGKEYGFG